MISFLKDSPILFDGGMGTMLFGAGLKPGSSPELWNVEHPEKVLAIQKAYVEAGAQCLTTNTFGGTPLQLAGHGLAERCAELNRAAVLIARKAMGPDGLVIGDVGPFGGFLEPYGEVTEEAASDSFKTQIGALAEAGVDAILVESMVDANESALAIQAAKERFDLPVIATFAFEKRSAGQFHTMMGWSPVGAIIRAKEAGADIVGANCGTALSLSDYLSLGQEIFQVAGNTPVMLQPNAGPPQGIQATPEEFAGWADCAIEMGVKIVGGCCGTTPEHIRAMRRVLRK